MTTLEFLAYVIGGLVVLFIISVLVVMFAYLIGKALNRGRIDAYMERLRQAKKERR